MKILVTDDSEDIRFMLRLNIEVTPGWELVGEAEDGIDAVELATRLQPDLVILDVAMPIMDGIEAARLIKEVAPNARILFFTAFDDLDARRRMKSVEADGFVMKHLPLDALKAEVERVTVCA